MFLAFKNMGHPQSERERLLPPRPTSLLGEMGFASLGGSRVGVVKIQVQTWSRNGGRFLTYKNIERGTNFQYKYSTHRAATGQPGSSHLCPHGHLGKRCSKRNGGGGN